MLYFMCCGFLSLAKEWAPRAGLDTNDIIGVGLHCVELDNLQERNKWHSRQRNNSVEKDRGRNVQGMYYSWNVHFTLGLKMQIRLKK